MSEVFEYPAGAKPRRRVRQVWYVTFYWKNMSSAPVTCLSATKPVVEGRGKNVVLDWEPIEDSHFAETVANHDLKWVQATWRPAPEEICIAIDGLASVGKRRAGKFID